MKCQKRSRFVSVNLVFFKRISKFTKLLTNNQNQTIMKKHLFLIILCAVCACASAYAQNNYEVENGSVVFTQVYENTGKSVDETHATMEAYFARIFNDVNSTEKLNQPDHFIYKGMFVRTGEYQMAMWTIDVPYTLDVAIKENRMRVKVTITNGIYRSLGTAPYRSEYTISEAAPFETSKKAKVLKKESAHTFEVVQGRINDIFRSIDAELKSSSNNNNDW